MGDEDYCHIYLALRSELLMNLPCFKQVKYVLQLLLILRTLCSLPYICAAHDQRSCSAHAIALSAHAALIAGKLSGGHVQHFLE